MREQIPSKTAYRVALRRAAHQLMDHPPVIDDPLAVRIVGQTTEEIHAGAGKDDGGSRSATSLRAFVVARSRFAEEKLAEGIANGVKQYLILGAGLDISPYRGIAAESRIKVFEVDHPATQSWKKEMLSKAGIAVPGP